MKKLLSFVTALTILFSFGTSAYAIEEGPDQFPANPIINDGPAQYVVDSQDSSWANTSEIYPAVEEANDCGCGSNPKQIRTDMLDIKGVPLEYTIRDGNLVIFPRPGLYYYKQNARQTWLNEYTAKVVSTWAEGYGTYVSYKIVSRVPYIARLLNLSGREVPYNFSDWAVSAGSYMAQKEVPLWGKIISANIPSAGTKEVVVYISKTGKDRTWHYRARFVVDDDGNLTIRKWTVGL